MNEFLWGMTVGVLILVALAGAVAYLMWRMKQMEPKK